ncbi:MAG: glycoside hydrolase family 3 C-terminal domain-containing protein [Anaerolineales bacterium]|nr:glycoside hydrolase family 3 C-terminal domain-containing protein [Anaerolineales bacterium]
MRKHKFLSKLGWLGLFLLVAWACIGGASTPFSTMTAIPPTATAAPGATARQGAAETSSASLDPFVEQRVTELLAQMTLEEKIGQMTQLANQDPSQGWRLRDPQVAKEALLGGALAGGDGNPAGANTAENWYAMVEAYQRAALSTRLGIPLLFGIDAMHGNAHMTGTTIFPHNVGLGATRNPELIRQVCQVTAAEMNAAGLRWTFAPVVAVPQDVRWGRTYEGYGEDTGLVGQLGAACLTGLQGVELTDPNTVAGTPKHFLGDGGTAYGSSTQNIYRPFLLDQGVVMLDDEEIEELFLPPYEQAVRGGARIIMVSYSSTQSGGKMHGNRHWLTDVLKTRLGFTGFIVSDFDGIDQVDSDYRSALKQSINAGIDMVMMSDDWRGFQSDLRSLVLGGEVPQPRIDDAVRRILRVKFEMGLFENPMPPSGKWESVGWDANRAVARRAAAESAVLLKTGPGVLPIAKSGETVLLAGRGADDIGLASGGWTLTWQGQPGNVTAGTTLMEALEDQLGGSLSYSPDAGFSGGTRADIGIVVVAEPPYAEGVGDSADLRLPTDELALIPRMKPLVRRLIVVIYSGRPVLLGGIGNQADAVIAAWLPGTEAGTGLADVLLGEKDFTGTTPYTWPKTPNDAPRFGKAACEGAVYPYGYGLRSDGGLLGSAACSAADGAKAAGSNLALRKPVRASSIQQDPALPDPVAPEYAVDGDTGTRWSSAYADPQWIQVDLGDVHEIGRVVLHWEAAYASAFQIQVSDDGAAWTTVYSTDLGYGGVDDLAVSGRGRYIRIYGTARGTPYGYSLWEFEVYGPA